MKLTSFHLAALPLLHIASSAVYLNFYSRGFGEQIQRLFTSSDVFDVSLSVIIPTYIGIALGSLIGFIPKKITYSSHKSQLLKTMSQDEVSIYLKKEQNILLFGITFILIVNIIFSIWLFYYKKIPTLAILLPSFSMWLVTVYAYYTHIRSIPRMNIEIILAAAVYMALFAGFGFDDGWNDRNRDVKFFSNYPKCEDYSIIRNLSIGLLAISNDGSRSVINEECRETLSFSPVN